MRKFGLIFGLFVIGFIVSVTLSYLPSDSLQEESHPEMVETTDLQDEPDSYSINEPDIAMLVTKEDDPKPTSDLEESENYLSSHEPQKALEIIKQHLHEIEDHSEEGKKWLALFIQASDDLNNTTQLLHLYEFQPEAFSENESASLKVGAAMLANDLPEEYLSLRNLWKGKEKHVSRWVLLDADELLLENKKSEAMTLLSSQPFSDESEFGRLLRLGALHQEQNPKKALHYFEEAKVVNPKHPTLILYLARTLKNIGHHDKAMEEYRTAAEISTDNPSVLNELADYYISQRKYPEALAIWQGLVNEGTNADVWLKFYFWNRVAQTVDFNWKKAKFPEGEYRPLLEYLTALRGNEFWNEELFDKLSHSHLYLSKRQETFWLRLLSAIQNQDMTKAEKLLNHNTFLHNSWSPDLQQALEQIIAYRTKDSNETPEHLTPSSKKEHQSKPLFFQHLDYYLAKNPSEMPQPLHSLLKSKEVFTAALLSEGWNEAAIDLHQLTQYPKEFPDWVSIAYTEALEKNRDSEEALEFAKKQPGSPELNFIVGELYLEEGNTANALKSFIPLATDNSQIGMESAILASLIYVETGEYSKAKQTVRSQPLLSKDVKGKEILARIALRQGETQKADTLYKSIVNRSLEAKSYLARKAFADKDWKLAEKLTEELLEDQPDNPMLLQNLQKIKEHESNR